MTALYKHPVTLTHAHIVAVVAGVGHIAFQTFFFFFLHEPLAEILNWVSPETTEQELEVLVTAKFRLH